MPTVMKYIRQSALQKPNKPAKVENLRPLSIFTVWWRAYEASTMRTKAYRRWRRALELEGVAYRESAEEIAAWVATQYATSGYLAALDYSRAYDHMNPKISEELMKTTGVPEDIVETLVDVWGDQRRYIQFDGHTSKEILQGDTAQPQGGPWGPPLMQLWMMCGVLFTSREVDEEGFNIEK